MLYYVSVCITLLVIANILKVKIAEEKWSTILLVLILIVFIIIIYALLIILLIFGTYRSIVYVFAKFKYGSSFLGFVEGIDVMYASNCVSKNMTTFLLLVEDKHDKNDIFETIKNVIEVKILQNTKVLPKFQSTFVKFMGYRCIIKKSICLKDCIKKLTLTENKELDENKLMNLLGECYNLPLPNDETNLWDVFVGVQKIEATAKCYPVFVRIHQSVADGTSLLKFFTEILPDSEVIETLTSESELKIKEPSETLIEFLQISVKNALSCCLSLGLSAFDGFYTLILAPSSLLDGFKYKGEERNFIYKPAVSGKEILAFKVEESTEYVDRVKRIKRKVPGSTFTDVMITAFSGSLRNYYQKHSPLYPEYLTAGIHVLPDNKNTKASIIYMNLPLFFESDENEPMINRLSLVKSQTDFSSKSTEMQINRFIRGLACSVTPTSIVQNIFGEMQCPSTLCLVPGPLQFTIANGALVVTKCIFWLPQQNNCGINLSLLTYNNRLHLGINSDKTQLRSLEAAQEILNGIFQNLDQLEKELAST